MTPEIKNRIEQIRQGEVPEGYKHSSIGITPKSWGIHAISQHLWESCLPGNPGNIAKKITVKLWNKGVIEKQEVHQGSANTQYYRRKGGQFIYSKLDFLNCAFGIIPPELDGYESTQDLPAFDITGINPRYLLLQITQRRFYERWGIMSANGGRKARRISPEDFLTFPIPFPCLEEQQKIVAILTVQNKIIELKENLLTEKQRQKKYLVQQLLTGKKRLPGFADPWKKIKLCQVLTERTEKNEKQHLHICSVAVQKGVVDQVEHLGRSYAAADTSNYGAVYHGDIIYTKSPTGDFPYGIIKQSQLNKKVAVSPLYGIYKPISFAMGYLLHTYFGYAINAKNYLLPVVQKGAKNTINITNSRFISNSLYLPMDPKEQSALAEVFTVADKEIRLLQQSLEQEKQKKKALMQLLLTGIVRVNV